MQSLSDVPLFSRSFRPFFLGAMIFSIVTMLIWLSVQMGASFIREPIDFYWHGGTFVFGYSSAVVAGFLLTAVGEWTGKPSLAGGRLFFLFFTWVLSQLPYFFSFGMETVLLFKFLFWGAFVFFLCPYIIFGQSRNYIFLFAVCCLGLIELLFHYSVLTGKAGLARGALHMGLGFLMLLIVVVSTRVLPFFTMKALGDSTVSRKFAFSLACFVAVVVYNSLVAVSPRTDLISALLFACALVLLWPLRSWWRWQILKVPMLLVLYVGYVWIVIGIMTTSLSQYFQISPRVSIHALSIGGLGVMTYGMMSRVSLGHTGRKIQAGPWLGVGFVLINLSVIVRICADIWTESYQGFIIFAAVLWIASFLFLLLRFIPILISARASE